MNRLATCLIAVSSVLMWPRQGMVSDFSERMSLLGLHGIAVQVVISGEPAFKRLVSADGLRAEIESKLSRSGIHVMDQNELNKDSRLPSLDLRLIAVPWTRQQKGEPLGYSVSVRLVVNQVLWIVQKDSLGTSAFGDTWSKDYVLNYRVERLRKGALSVLVGRMTDQFTSDWLLTAREYGEQVPHR